MVIDLRRGTPDVAKHIVDAINSMAKIKQEQINIEKSKMIDQIKRGRDIEDYKKKKDIDREDRKKVLGMDDIMPDQSQSSEVEQTAVGPQGRQITGQAQGPTPQAVRDPIWRGVELRPPGSKGKNITADDIRYAGIYKKVVSGGDISEGEEKALLKYNEEGKMFDKYREVLSNVTQGGIYNKQYGDINELDGEQAKSYVQSELGLGWEKKFPEIKEAMDEKYGKGPRDQAIKVLTDKGFPVTDANIKELMKQMGNK